VTIKYVSRASVEQNLNAQNSDLSVDQIKYAKTENALTDEYAIEDDHNALKASNVAPGDARVWENLAAGGIHAKGQVRCAVEDFAESKRRTGCGIRLFLGLKDVLRF